MTKPLVAVLAGDGIGRETVPQAVKVLLGLGLDFELVEAPVGGAGLDTCSDPLPPDTRALAERADAILFGAVGGPEYEHWPRAKRAGSRLLRLRKELGLFANLRPVRLFPELKDASPLKPEVIDGLDLVIVRELNGDIYFGEPRGRVSTEPGQRVSVNTMRYTESEIERIAHVAFRLARERKGRLCSVDKANVLETMALWREVVSAVGRTYPDVELTHLYVDAAAMQIVRAPTQFDVILTANMFGDILSDEASVLTGSIGMLPSASLGMSAKGLYEPIHGSAPDIAEQDIANPLATILSAAMLLRHSLGRPAEADRIEHTVGRVLAAGLRTADIQAPGNRCIGTKAMGNAVVDAL